MMGFLNIYKPKGMTSHDVVARLRRVTKIKQIGHTGTLDPFAEGVLPVCIGKATRLIEYLSDDKEYLATVQFGVSTTTYDIEGDITYTSDKKITQGEVENILDNFRGEILQMPPIYSAIKVKGKKLYEYARKGEKIEVEPRKIEIYKIELVKYNEKNIEFIVSCSKGTYIRSLCEDIAEKLNTVGYMKNLERLQVGEFNIEKSVLIDDVNTENIEKYLYTLEDILKDTPNLNLNPKKLKLFLNGVQLTVKEAEGLYKIYVNNKFIGTGTVKKNLLKRDIII